MNYRHIYHAGSFSDVLKHVVLTFLMQSLLRKEKGFCYIDTHAGSGLYDLHSKAAQKNKEVQVGIQKLITLKNTPDALAPYFSSLQSHLPNFYPGSPLIARHFLRPQDRMILTELHPEEYAQLKSLFVGDKQVAVHHENGYQALKAFLPPAERRGLVLIDPPYEKNDEYTTLCNALKMALNRWENGIYAVWYPIKEARIKEQWYRELEKLPAKNILLAELTIFPEDTAFSLNGSGMAIINAPYQLDKQLQQVLPWLWEALSPEKQGKQRVTWIK